MNPKVGWKISIPVEAVDFVKAYGIKGPMVTATVTQLINHKCFRVGADTPRKGVSFIVRTDDPWQVLDKSGELDIEVVG